ncbi:hypothetical protein C0J52_21707 [Blattella germanica]|nr:hypothetical protein C0J52_21707 [Blattella germanica]
MCFFLLINSLTWILITDFCSDIQKLGADLSDSIYSVLFIASFTFCIWIPLLTWLDARSTCRYFKAWAEFQLKFRAVTKDRVQLNIRKYSIVAFLPVVGSGLFVVLLSRMTPHSEPWKMPVPITGCVHFSTLVILKIFMFIALHKAGTALDSAFKRDLALKPTSPNLVEEYRLLWLRWSRLVSQEEDMFGTVYAFTLVKMLFIVVITLYCSLMDLKTGQVNYERQLNTCSPCAFGMATLYFICRNAHRLSDLVREPANTFTIYCMAQNTKRARNAMNLKHYLIVCFVLQCHSG